jgi:hypothetical protein
MSKETHYSDGAFGASVESSNYHQGQPVSHEPFKLRSTLEVAYDKYEARMGERTVEQISDEPSVSFEEYARKHVDIRDIASAADQRSYILELLAPVLDKLEVFGSDVLIATYIEAEKTKGGIIRPDMNLRESIFQGKVGVMLKPGEDAFLFRGSFPYHTKRKGETDEEYLLRVEKSTPKLGDWLYYRTSDAWMCKFNGVNCRIIPDSCIKGRIADPELIY